MKPNLFFYLIFLVSITTCSSSFSQKKGFESLAYFKTSLESIVKQYGASMPDTSKVYKSFYLPISKQYNGAKANYAAYLGAMKDCILNNNSEKKIKECLGRQTLNIENNLDTLRSLFDNAYIQYYIQNPTSIQKINETKNNALITADIIKGLISDLVDAGIKIWDEFQKKNKQFKDDYLTNLQSKDYALGDFDDLVKQASGKK